SVSGVSVFVDAIFLKAEFDLLKSRVPADRAYVLAIEASFDLRCDRLANRSNRPFSREELTQRDKTELFQLGTGAVMAAANHTIRNEDSLQDFHARLSAFWESFAV